MPCPHPRPGPRQYSWVTELSTGNAGCCTPGNGFVLLQCLSRSPLQSPRSLGECTQCPEMARSPRGWSKGFARGILLVFGSVKAWDGDSVKRQEGYGVSRMEKEIILIPQGQSSLYGKAPSQTTQGSLEILQGRISHGRTPHLLQTRPTPLPLHHLLGLAVPCRARRCKAFAGLTQSVVTTKTENPVPRASPADFSLTVPFQCSTGE